MKETLTQAVTFVESPAVAETSMSPQQESIQSLWALIRENKVFVKGAHTYQIHWIQPVGEVIDVGIMIDGTFHDNAVLPADRNYTAEMIATIFDWEIQANKE